MIYVPTEKDILALESKAVKEEKLSTFSRKLNAVMYKQDLPVMSLAKLTKLSSQTIRNWLDGKSLPNKDTMNQLIGTIKVNPAWLTGAIEDEELDAEYPDAPSVIGRRRTYSKPVEHIPEDTKLKPNNELMELIRLYSNCSKESKDLFIDLITRPDKDQQFFIRLLITK